MLVREFKAIIKRRSLVVGIGVLLLGQVLYSLFDFGALYIVALLYVLVIGLPYPNIVRSTISRTVLSVLLLFGFVQVAATVQFFVARDSMFGTLSLITTLLVVAAVLAFYRFRADEKLVHFDRKDAGAVLAAAFFVLPLMAWCATPARITSFGGLQSPDGASHNAGIGEMAGAQHLTYRTNANYYPKGFHIAQALVMDSFHVLQRDQSWVANVRTYIAQYLLWGFVVVFVLQYVGRQLAGWLLGEMSLASELLLAVLIGSALSLFYLLPFAQEGFLNYYYICAVFIAGLLFLPAFQLKSREDHWLVIAYFLGAFGITMSWGPLLLPALVLTPALGMLMQTRTFSDLKLFLASRKYLTMWAGFAALAVPLYVHFTYSHSTSFNAEGSIRVFNIGLIGAGVALLGYAAFSNKLAGEAKRFVVSVLWPYLLLVGGLAAVQYVTVGMPRYYSIKTSYLIEMLIIAVLAVLLLRIALQSKTRGLQLWLIAPVVFGIGLFAALSLGGNALRPIQAMLNKPVFLGQDTQKITQLGLDDELHGHNNAVLHYDAMSNKIFGNELIPNWANGLSPSNDGDADSAACNSVIYNTLTYGSGTPDEQKKLIAAIKTCINLRIEQGKAYYIVTDPGSQDALRRILGENALFL